MISSMHNPQIKLARTLHRSRGRSRSGLCLLEGLRLVRDAWQSGVTPQPLFYLPAAAASNPALAALVQEIATQGGEVLACTPSLFAALADTVTPQGIAAIVPIPALPLPAAPELVLILDSVQDPGNVGALLRTAEAAGADLVILGPETVDGTNPKVLRSAMGAHFRLPMRQCSQWTDVGALLPPAAIYLADLNAALVYDQVDWTQPAVLIVSNEANGPSPEARGLGQAIHIPMRGQVESLNVAISGALLLFEAARQRRQRVQSAQIR